MYNGHFLWLIQRVYFLTHPVDIFIIYDDKGKLIKAGHYVSLRRATLLSQPNNEKVYSLGDYVAVCSDTNDWFMCNK